LYPEPVLAVLHLVHLLDKQAVRHIVEYSVRRLNKSQHLRDVGNNEDGGTERKLKLSGFIL